MDKTQISADRSLEGRSAVVTGAAQGLGRAIAEALSSRGASVLLADIKLIEVEAAAADIRARGGRAVAFACDVSRVDDIRRMTSTAVADFGGLDILVNNAGILHKTPIEDITEEEWDRIMAVNLKSVFLTCKYALPVMIAQGSGAIVNTASTSGIRFTGNAQVGYAASKAGVIQFTRASASLSPKSSALNLTPTSGICSEVWKSRWTWRNREATRSDAEHVIGLFETFLILITASPPPAALRRQECCQKPHAEFAYSGCPAGWQWPGASLRADR